MKNFNKIFVIIFLMGFVFTLQAEPDTKEEAGQPEITSSELKDDNTDGTAGNKQSEADKIKNDIDTIVTGITSIIAEAEKVDNREKQILDALRFVPFARLILIILGALAILCLLMLVFINISKNKKIKKLENIFNNELMQIREDLAQIKRSLDTVRLTKTSVSPELDRAANLEQEREKERLRIKLEEELRERERERERQRNKQAEEDRRKQEETERIIKDMETGRKDPVEMFNTWALNPLPPLPEPYFCYLKGEPKLRKEWAMIPADASQKTNWITNKYGNKKYLFPNPNTFDQFTDITEFYKMDLALLKSKGNNRIKITDACEMAAATGFINFSGKLELL